MTISVLKRSQDILPAADALGSCAPVEPLRGFDEVAEIDLWTLLCELELDPEELFVPCDGDCEVCAPLPPVPEVCVPPVLVVPPVMFLSDREDPDRLPSLSTCEK